MKLIIFLIYSLFFISCSQESGGSGESVNFDRSQLGSLNAVDPKVQNLGEVPYKTPYEVFVEIKNSGILTSRDISPVIDEEENPVFYYTGEDYPGELGTCGEILAPGESCTLHFTFFTDESGEFKKSFLFNYHDGESKKQKQVVLSAKAGEPAKFEFLESTSGLYDLGGQDITQGKKSKMITLKNVGDLSARNISYELQGKTAEDNMVFSFTGGSFPGIGGTCGNNVSGGEECTVSIDYLALEKDKSYRTFLNLSFDNPTVRSTNSAVFRVLGIEDRAFLTVFPQEQYLPAAIVNTSTDSQFTWRFSNVGSRAASSINFNTKALSGTGNPAYYFNDTDISLELVSTDCDATLEANDFCDATYKLKPNFPSDRVYPVYLEAGNMRTVLSYDDGKTVGLRENDDSVILGIVLGEGDLRLQKNNASDNLITDLETWGVEQWTHTYGNPKPIERELGFLNGLTELGRLEITELSVNITPNDGLLKLDANPSTPEVESVATEIAAGSSLVPVPVLSYRSNLDESTYPYTDPVNKIREYNVEVSYNNQVETKNISFKVIAKDNVSPLISFAKKVIIEDDPETDEDESEIVWQQINETTNNSDNASQSGVSENIYEPFAYSGSEFKSQPLRVYNYGFTAITPNISKVLGANSDLFSYETIGTTCDSPISGGDYCEFQIVFRNDTAIDTGDLSVMPEELAEGQGVQFTGSFKINDDYDVNVLGSDYPFDQELDLNFQVANRKKGELIVETEHNPNNRPVGDPSFDIYQDTDFVGDFQIVDALYDGETQRIIEGDEYILYFSKQHHGEINHLNCEITGLDKDYFGCSVEEIATDETFADHLTSIGKTSEDYDYTKHVKYKVRMSFEVNTTTTFRSYAANLKLSYHGKKELETDPYNEPDDILNVALSAEVKGEPNFIFDYLAEDIPLDLGDFKIEESLSPIPIRIKNIGGDMASVSDGNVVLNYPSNLFSFSSFDDSSPDCSFISQSSGRVTFNASPTGECVAYLTPTLLGPLKDADENNLLVLNLEYYNSYELNNKQLELTANQLDPFTLAVDSVDLTTPEVAFKDLRVGEVETKTFTIKTQLGKDSELIDSGSGNPFILNIDDIYNRGEVYFSNADDNANCDFDINPTPSSPAVRLELIAKAGAECDVDVSVHAKTQDDIISSDIIGTDGNGDPLVEKVQTFNFEISYPTSNYIGKLSKIDFDDQQVIVLKPYTLAYDGVDLDMNAPVLAIPDLKVGEEYIKNLTFKTNLAVDSRTMNAGAGLPFYLTINDIGGYNHLEIIDSTSNSDCLFNTTATASSPLLSVELHSLTPQAQCDITIRATGKKEFGLLTENWETGSGDNSQIISPKNLDIWTDYDPISLDDSYRKEIKFDDNHVKVVPALAINNIITFGDLYLGDSEEYTIIVENNAVINSNNTYDYYNGPITLEFKDGLNALGSLSISMNSTPGCTPVLEEKYKITYHALPETDCSFQVKANHASYSDDSLSQLANKLQLLHLRAKIDDFESSLDVVSGRLLDSFDMLPDPTDIRPHPDNTGSVLTFYLGKDVAGSQLTHDFTVASLSSFNSNAVKKAGSNSETIDPIEVIVTDTDNYSIDWRGGSPNTGCYNMGTIPGGLRFHADAGVSCEFTLTFDVPAVGARYNEVHVNHVGNQQDKQVIYGAGLNYARLISDKGEDPIDLGTAQASASTNNTIFNFSNTATDAADGQIQTSFAINSSCDNLSDDDIPEDYRAEEGSTKFLSDPSVFTIQNNSCGGITNFRDDSEDVCSFEIEFAPILVERVYTACLTYTYKRYPTEPEFDGEGNKNWREIEIPLFAKATSPPLNFPGFDKIAADGDSTTDIQWQAMSINTATITGYNVYRKTYGAENFDPVSGYQNVTDRQVSEVLTPGEGYTYLIKAIVEYDAEPGEFYVKTPNQGESSEFNLTFPLSNQTFIHNLIEDNVIVDKTPNTFSTQIDASNYCQSISVGGTPMSLISPNEFTKLATNSQVSDVVGSWEYVGPPITLPLDYPAFSEEELGSVGGNGSDSDLVLNYVGQSATCKLDRLNYPDNPPLIRYGMAGGSGFGLSATENTFFYCYRDYPWIDLSGYSYPEDVGARCIVNVP